MRYHTVERIRLTRLELTDAVHASVIRLITSVAHAPVRSQGVDAASILAQSRNCATFVNIWKHNYIKALVVSVTENRGADTKPNTYQIHRKIPKPNQLKNIRKYQLLPNSQALIHSLGLIIPTKYQKHWNWNTKYQVGIGLVSIYQKVGIRLTFLLSTIQVFHISYSTFKMELCTEIGCQLELSTISKSHIPSLLVIYNISITDFILVIQKHNPIYH